MIDKKRMILLAGTVLVLLIVVSVLFVWLFTSSRKSIEYRELGTQQNLTNAPGDKMGIGYGGNFDESAKPDAAKQQQIKRPDIQSIPEIADMAGIARSPEELHAAMMQQGEGSEHIYNEEDPLPEMPTAAPELDRVQFEQQSEEPAVEIEDGEVSMDELGLPILQSDGYYPNEVLCDTETEKEAQEIATQIAGTLLYWKEGTALIQIEGSVDELLAQLKQQGSNLVLYRHYCF